MDEGRLAVVFRQEERHRKFVYMMNDIVRSRLGLYTNCLDREQHESSVKLLKNCSDMRRAIVRQKVLRQCLEMRKRKIVDRDPTKLYGQYGGKPLWSLSRDIDRVIADNHPRVRRLKRVEEAMRQSLENGDILDEEAVARRIETFFQLKQAKQQRTDRSPERAQDHVFQGPALRRNFFKPPSWATDASVSQGSLPSQRSLQPDTAENPNRLKPDSRSIRKESSGKLSTKEPSGKDSHGHSDALGVVNRVSLDVDSKGRLRGIKTNLADTSVEKERFTAIHRKPQKASGVKAEHGSYTRTGRTEQAGGLASRGDGDDWECNAEEKTSQQCRASEEKPRSKLILPPIESSKALVSKH